MKVGFVIGADTYSSSLYSATVDVANQLRLKGVELNYIFLEHKEPLLDSDEHINVWGLSKASKGSKLFIKLMKSVLGYNVYCAIFSRLFCRQIEAFVEDHGYDVLFFHVTSFAPFYKYRKTNFVVLHTCIFENLVQRYRGIKKWFYRCFYALIYKDQSVLSVSKSACEDLLVKVRARPKTLETVFNGFDFEALGIRASMKPEISLPEKFIMAAGRPDRTKRFDLLLKAFSLTESKSEYSLLIFGEGRGLNKLRALASSLGVENRVEFRGFFFPLLSIYKYASLYVLSSDVEGLPTVIIESLVAGTPVVSTDAGGVEELMGGELAKYVSPRGDAEKLANNIDAAIRDQLLVSADRVAFLSSEIVAESYMQVLEKIR